MRQCNSSNSETAHTQMKQIKIICGPSLPLPEFLEEDSVWKALSANSDTFKYTIASQLVKDKVSINLASSFLVVWYDTTDKIGARAIQGIHQVGKLFLHGMIQE